MSLNHKRRIFRAHAKPLPFRDRRLPSLAVLLATASGVVTLVVAVSLFVRSSEAPAHVPANLRLSAPAASLAVLDGDTLRLGDQVVRLAGITAPARGSVCHGSGQESVDCGVAAANALASLVRGSAVDCTIHGHDDQGRPVGNCRAGDTVLSEALVRNGWARAEAADLQDPQTTARAAGRGIWRTGS
ncbi:thermonuclease family protein [Acidisphaera sp. S103]|uniref:thermonuclease family protein n=1 Tax=Acidisphaera sp. S103 TaxID=1747223 RepID=UPI00131D820E|nr:thermonuclease family protein [Acidisphaera sp. S103]